MTTEIIGQAIGIVAMAFNVLSYQTKNSKSIILFQLVGTLLFSINFFLIKAYVGAMLNVLGMIRALAYANKDKLKLNTTVLLIVFSVLFASTYALIFTVFEKPFTLFNAIVEILPVCSMVLSTIAYGTEAKTFRIFALIFSPLWLVYNIIVFSIGAIICEALCIISAFVALLRYRKKQE